MLTVKPPQKALIPVLLLLSLLINGCAMNLIPGPGDVAEPEAITSLVDNGINNDVLQTKDLVFGYSVSISGDLYTLQGDLYIAGHITNSFPLVNNFFLKMSFLDVQGRVITTTDITPLLRHLYPVPEDLKLRASGKLPPGTKAVAFSYFGEFSDNSLVRGDSASWGISYFPFVKKPT